MRARTASDIVVVTRANKHTLNELIRSVISDCGKIPDCGPRQDCNQGFQALVAKHR
jgi:hypothetical protein